MPCGPRRRRFGRALFGASLAAVPLTATVSFAAQEPPLPPPPPAPVIEQKEDIKPADNASLHTRVIERDGDMRKVIRLRICEAQAAKANAADAVRRARSRIEQDMRLSPAMRAEILRELDAEIASLAAQGG